MKQKGLITLLAAILCFSLCSCGSNGASGSSESTETAETAQDNGNSQAQEEQAIIEDDIATSNFTDISLGDSIDLDFVEMTLERLEICDKYEFSYTKQTTVGTSTQNASIEPSAGMKLVSLVGVFTNKTNKDYYTSNKGVYGKFQINGNEYTAKFKCYDTETAESFLTVAAQQAVTYFLYAEVPQNVADNIDGCIVQFGFTQDFESKPISNVEDLDYIYQLVDIPSESNTTATETTTTSTDIDLPENIADKIGIEKDYTNSEYTDGKYIFYYEDGKKVIYDGLNITIEEKATGY